MLFADRPRHVISGVYDTKTGEGFSVDNTDVETMPGKLDTDAKRQAALKVATSTYRYSVDAVGVGETPSEADRDND